jgi:hypothetical protein
MPFLFQCCVYSSRGLCVELIVCQQGSYRVWCLWGCSWTLDNKEAVTHYGLSRRGGKYPEEYKGLAAVLHFEETKSALITSNCFSPNMW